MSANDLMASAIGNRRAFRVHVADFIGTDSIVFTTSPAKAKFAVWRTAQDCGFEFITFQKLKVRRAPEFDALSLMKAPGRAYGIDFIRTELSPPLTSQH